MEYNCMGYNREVIATITFKLHMTITEIKTTLLLERYDQSALSVRNHFWLPSSVDFAQIISQKYIVSNILVEFYGKDVQFASFCEPWRTSHVTSSVTNYCCQKVTSKIIICDPGAQYQW